MDKKFNLDLIWNYGSIVIIGAGGLSLNYLIAYSFSSTGLGVFNQIYAFFVIFGQFAAVGIHYSVLKSVAKEDKISEQAVIIGAAVMFALPIGVSVSAIVFLSSGWIGVFFESALVGEGILYASLGLTFFAVNKILLSALNGRRDMVEFAVFQALRVIALLVGGVVLATVDANIAALGYLFLFSESILLICLVIVFFKRGLLALGGNTRTWIRHHSIFGMKSVVGGFLAESQIRIDVIMLGFFVSDSLVGIYSLASTLGEGFFNLLVVVRNNVNPVLVRLFRSGEVEAVKKLAIKIQLLIYPAAFLVGGLVVVLFPVFIELFFYDSGYGEAIDVLAVLIFGFAIYSGFLPFDFALLQLDRPSMHTIFMGCVTITNIFLNVILIPQLGIFGAAIATATTYLVTIFYLNFIMHQVAGFSFIPTFGVRKRTSN